MLLPRGFLLTHRGVHTHISALSASFMMFWLFPREEVSRLTGGRVRGLMPINTVKWCMWLIEFRGRGKVEANGQLSPGLYLHSGLAGGEGLAGWGSQLALPSSPWKTQPAQHQIVGGREGKGRLAQLLTGCFPLTRSLEVQTLIFEQACGGGFGLCECVCVSGADFLGSWRKEMRLKELLLMGCGWGNEVCL